MKKIFFFSLATIAILFAGCKENNPDEPESANITTTTTTTTPPPVVTLIPGELAGLFSVSATQKVRFSKGNLQYNAAQNIWRFAEHQYDTIGAANKNISSSYNGYIDLFGWATSGYNNKNPWMISATDSDYGDGQNGIPDTEYDWGVHNAISNGGNEAGKWRTLTKAEWEYLFHGRANAQKLFALGSVNGINGTILLPDGWILPEGVTFNPSTSNGLTWDRSVYKNSASDANNYADNTYTLAKWAKMEANGAIFLPAAGYRNGTSVTNIVSDVGIKGNYWAMYMAAGMHASSVHFRAQLLYPHYFDLRRNGFSVRLVR